MFRLALHWQILIALVVGAVSGIVINAVGGTARMTKRMPVEQGSVQFTEVTADFSKGTFWAEDTPTQILMELDTQEDDGKIKRQRILIESPEDDAPEDWPSLPPEIDEVTQLKVLKLHSLKELTSKNPAAYALFQLHGRSTARWWGDFSKTMGDLFLRLLKMVSVPLIITSLLTGITGLGNAEQLGRLFTRTLLYYLSTSLIAITIGLVVVNIIQPGHRGANAGPANAVMGAADEEAVVGHQEGKGLDTVLYEQVLNLIPTNPFEAAMAGNFLSIISFTLAFGIFTLLVGGQTAVTVSEIANAAFAVMMKMTEAIIKLAPLGVLFLMFSATAGQGIAVFGTLGYYMLSVIIALMIHGMVVMPLILKFVAKRSPWEDAQAMSPALLMAFSSACSNGTLPLTLNCVEERAKISNRVSSFVLPLGATINMDGTALYEAVAVLFIAQLTPGIELTLAQQIIVAFTALLASVGAAGIPHAGLVMMIIILQAVGLPTESQGLIIAVDRVLDMARTSINVWSDSCGCAVVAQLESKREQAA